MGNGDLHIRRLNESLAEIPTLLSDGSRAHSPSFKLWEERTEANIKALVGNDGEAFKRFRRYSFCILRVGGSGGWTPRDQARYIADLHASQQLITDLLEEFDGARGETGSVALDFWKLIHPEIRAISQPRFESGQYADAVLASLREINGIVKARFRDAGRTEQVDGAKLMTAAFSLTTPVIVLDDLGTETGQNVQQGYMQIFAGTMTGIRNPKAHENITIDAGRAIHLLFLASLLRGKLDEAT